MAYEITVRLAGPADFWPLWRVMLEMHADNAVFPLAPDKASRWIANALASPDAWVFLAMIDGEVAGTIALQIDAPAYSHQNYLQECWIFVRPKYRVSRTAFRLINAAKDVERALKLPIIINVITPTQADRKVAFFKRYFSEVRHGLQSL